MYLRILELFILRTLFNKNEYNFKSKEFNSFKFIIIVILIGNFIFTIYLISSLIRIYHVIEQTCPQILRLSPTINWNYIPSNLFLI